MDCQPAAVPEAIMERNEEPYRACPNRKTEKGDLLAGHHEQSGV